MNRCSFRWFIIILECTVKPAVQWVRTCIGFNENEISKSLRPMLGSTAREFQDIPSIHCLRCLKKGNVQLLNLTVLDCITLVSVQIASEAQ